MLGYEVKQWFDVEIWGDTRRRMYLLWEKNNNTLLTY